MSEQGQIRFVRIRGRIVPIRPKGHSDKAPKSKPPGKPIVINFRPNIEIEKKGGGGGQFSVGSGLVAGGSTYAALRSYISGNAKVPEVLKDVIPPELARKGLGARQRQYDRILGKLSQVSKPTQPLPMLTGKGKKATKAVGLDRWAEYQGRMQKYSSAQKRIARFAPLAKQNHAILKSLGKFAPVAAIGVGVATAAGASIFGGGGN